MGYQDKVLSTKWSKATSTKYLTNVEIGERVKIIVDGLVEDKWIPYYCKAYKSLGESRFMAVVSTARTGNDPKYLIRWLMKQELAKTTT